MPKRIVHCANFGTVRLKGCYLASMGYKLTNGLIRLGHQVMCYSDRDMEKLFGIAGNRCFFSNKKNNENFLKFCLNVKPDIILLGHADTIKCETLLKIRNELPKVKILQWNVDAINPQLKSGQHNINNIKSKLVAVDYTLITTADKRLLAQFEPNKNNVGFIPNPVDKSIETARVFENATPQYDLFFASSPKAERDFCGHKVTAAQIAEILDAGCPDIKTLFPRLRAPSADGTEYMQLLAQSAMVLNLSCVAEDYLYSSDRMAHAIGNGCLALIDRRTGFGDIFGEDEIGFYSSQEELLEKINNYSQNAKLRCQIAKKGWEHYYDLFNESKIAQYVLDVIDENTDKAKYPFAYL